MTITLAAALRDATVEQLREDAKMCEFLINARPGDSDPMFRRLSALALAVARMQERSESMAHVAKCDPADVAWRVDSDGEALWNDAMYGDAPCSLPAALAALLEAE